MNFNNYLRDFYSLGSFDINKAEKEVFDQHYKDINKELKEKHLFHVVKDVILRDLQTNRYTDEGFTLPVIEKLAQRLRQENHDPEMIDKIKDIYIKQFLVRQEISVKENNMEQLFLFLQNQPERLFGPAFESFVKMLSLDSQLDLLKATVAKGEEAIGRIRFKYLDKLSQAPAEVRLELAKLMANQGENTARHLVRNLEFWNIASLSFQQRLELGVHLAKQGDAVLKTLQHEQTFKHLQAFESKEERIDFLKALVQKLYLEPKGLSIDLSQSFVSNAQALAELGGFPAILVAYHLDHIPDFSVIEILVTKEEAVFQALLDHLPDLNLKKYPAEKRLEILKLILKQDPPLSLGQRGVQNSRQMRAVQILEEIIMPEDSLETLLKINKIVKESRWNFGEDRAGTIFKYLPQEGVSLAQIKQLLKQSEVAPMVLVDFPLLRCSASPEEIAQIIPILLEQGEVGKGIVAAHAGTLSFEKLPPVQRLEILKSMLIKDEKVAESLAGQLNVIGIKDYPIKEQLDLVKKIILVGGESAAIRVRENINLLKLSQASLSDRMELAFLLAKSNIGSLLFYFNLRLGKDEERYQLARLMIAKGEYSARNLLNNAQEIGLSSLPLEMRKSLVEDFLQMNAEDLGVYPNLLGLETFPLEDRIAIAQKIALKTPRSVIQGMMSNHWKFDDIPFTERLKLAGIITQDTHVAGLLNLVFVQLFGTEFTTQNAALIMLSKQSNALVADMLLRPVTSEEEIRLARRLILEFLIDTPADLSEIFDHAATQDIKLLLNLLTMKTVDVQDEVNALKALPKDTQKAIVELKQFLESQDKLRFLLSTFTSIQVIKNPMTQFQLMRWLAYTAGVFLDMDTERLQAIKDSNIIETIYNHKSLEDRFLFIFSLEQLDKNFVPQPSKHEYGELARIMLAKGFSEEQANRIHDLIDGRSTFKTTRNFSPLVDLIHEVNLLPSINEEQRVLFGDRLESILRQKTIDAVNSSLQTLTNILTLFGEKAFFQALQEKDADAFFMEKFKANFSIGDMPDFAAKFQNTFGKSRDPNAIFTYMRSIERLPQEEREIAKQHMAMFIKAVLDGTFPEMRYQTDNRPHLQQIFASEEVKQRWMDKGEPVQVGQYTISITDDFMDLLEIGTEVPGSCQHVAATPHTNKCLLATIWNGGILPIVAKDKQGKIAARILVESDVDKQTLKRVILKTPLYHGIQDQDVFQAMDKKALEKAQQLNAPLVKKDKYPSGTPKIYPGTVSFLGGDYPYVYSDAAGGIVDGIKGFDLKDCEIIWEPKST